MIQNTRPQLAWRLAVLMAEREIRTTRALRRKLMAHGVTLSEAQLGRIVKALPRQLSTELLAGLCAVLDVVPGQLITIPGKSVPVSTPSTPATASVSSPAKSPVKGIPKVLPRSSTGRPQATTIPKPKY